MTEVPDLETATERFASFLEEHSLPTPIAWMFREDTWQDGQLRLFVRFPSHPGNEALAAAAYERGRSRGVVELAAIGHDGTRTFATVWHPARGEEVQGWTRGLKLTIRQPCPIVRRTSPFAWCFLSARRGFGRYQRECHWIGTRAWAARD